MKLKNPNFDKTINVTKIKNSKKLQNLKTQSVTSKKQICVNSKCDNTQKLKM